MKNQKNGFIIHEVVKGKKYAVCKVLDEVKTEKEATEILIDLLTKKRTEKEVLKDYQEKEVY